MALVLVVGVAAPARAEAQVRVHPQAQARTQEAAAAAADPAAAAMSSGADGGPIAALPAVTAQDATPSRAATLSPQAAGDAVWPTAGWWTSTPEEQGMSSDALASIVERGTARGVDSVLVTRHGRIVAEAYYPPYRAGLVHGVNSATKAVLGLLVGMASADGLMGPLDRPVADFFPERAAAASFDARWRGVTLAHLLDMTSGIDWQEPLDGGPVPSLLALERSADWLGFVLGRPVAHAPGTVFNYNSGTWHLLSAVLAQQAGRSTAEYARARLFAPLGINEVLWRSDRQGVSSGGFGLYLQPRDMAKLGYLLLRQGVWERRQLVPAAWVERVRAASVDMGFGTQPAFRYASGWWVVPEKRALMAVGFNRQLIVVLPDLDVVAVFTGRSHYPLVALLDALAAAVRSSAPLPPDPAGGARLAASVQAAAAETRSAVRPAPAFAAALSGRPYRFDDNPLRIAALTLDLSASGPRYEIVAQGDGRGAGRRTAGPIGLDGAFRSGEAAGTSLIAAKGAWTDERTFVIVTRSVLDGVESTYTLRYGDTGLDVEFANNRGAAARLHGRAAD